MKTISQQALTTLCQNGRGIDNKGGYPAVVIHPDNTVTKIWARKKRLLSSATFFPYSRRFVKNAQELARRQVTVPKIINHAALENSHIQIVTYHALTGQSIRELLTTNPRQINIPSLCRYINKLHEKGILFRAIHLGNIIQLDDQHDEHMYGLIDFTDLKFYSKPLPNKKRAMNLAVPLRYREDIQHITNAGLPDLLETYLDTLQLNTEEKIKFQTQVKHQNNH